MKQGPLSPFQTTLIGESAKLGIPKLYFTKVKCVRTPDRAYKYDAGIDFYVPNFPGFSYYGIWPQGRLVIPSGIHVRIPHGYMLKAEDKSGVGVKKGLKYIGGVIDEEYQGEISICLFNTSNQKVVIYPGEKIIQFILIPVLYSEVQEIKSLEELYPRKTLRGEGGFGSTNEDFKEKPKDPCNCNKTGGCSQL